MKAKASECSGSNSRLNFPIEFVGVPNVILVIPHHGEKLRSDRRAKPRLSKVFSLAFAIQLCIFVQ